MPDAMPKLPHQPSVLLSALCVVLLAACAAEETAEPPSDTAADAAGGSAADGDAATASSQDSLAAQDGDLPSEDAPPAFGTFVALTYNVHGLPEFVTGDETGSRMQQIAPMLDGFDILGLQEDFDTRWHAVLDEAASHEARQWFGDVPQGRFYGSGLFLLSIFKETHYAATRYDTCHGTSTGASDCLAAKGFQLMRVDLGGGAEVDVYNSHLEAGGGADDAASRARHVEQLIESMTKASAGRAILFLGDTNLHAHKDADALLLERWIETVGLKDACEEVGCPEPGRIDRVLYRDSAGLDLEATGWAVEERFVDGEGQPLSDHEAISASFRWERVTE